MKKMKKIFAGLLAATMVMSMNISAFAYTPGNVNVGKDESGNTVYAADEGTVTITKYYKAVNDVSNGPWTDVNGISPEETFEFEITNTSVKNAAANVTSDNMPTPTVSTVYFRQGAASQGNDGKGAEGVITVALPGVYTNNDQPMPVPEEGQKYEKYPSVGNYTYTIKEKDNGTAGVKYYTNDITLVVTVVQNDNGGLRVAAVHAEAAASDEKSDAFTNEYCAGTLAVKKLVTGNLGDQTKDFNVTVTFTAPEGDTVKEAISYVDDGESKTIAADWSNTAVAEITLKHNETVTFTNIPYGVTYTVVEDSYATDGYDAPVIEYSSNVYTNVNGSFEKTTLTNKDEGFEQEIGFLEDVNYSFGGASVLMQDRDFFEHEVVITNNKGVPVDTGIALDSVPYILLLAFTGLGVFTVIKKKREEEF